MPYLRIISGLQFCRWLLKIQKSRKVAHEFSVVQRVGIQFTLILRLDGSRKWFVVFSSIIKVDTKDLHLLVFVFLRMVLVCVCILVCFVDGTTWSLLVLCAFQQMCLQRAVWSNKGVRHPFDHLSATTILASMSHCLLQRISLFQGQDLWPALAANKITSTYFPTFIGPWCFGSILELPVDSC